MDVIDDTYQANSLLAPMNVMLAELSIVYDFSMSYPHAKKQKPSLHQSQDQQSKRVLLPSVPSGPSVRFLNGSLCIGQAHLLVMT